MSAALVGPSNSSPNLLTSPVSVKLGDVKVFSNLRIVVLPIPYVEPGPAPYSYSIGSSLPKVWFITSLPLSHVLPNQPFCFSSFESSVGSIEKAAWGFIRSSNNVNNEILKGYVTFNPTWIWF